MYSIAKQKDKTEENEDSIEGNEEPSPIHRVVRKILDQSSLDDVIINNRIIECFRSKIKELIKKGKNATKQGGASFKRLISKWQTGTKQYNFKVYFSETSKIGLHRNINRLKAEKRKLESDIAKEKAKCMKVEAELSKAKNSANYWRKRFKSVVSNIIKKQRKAEGRKAKPKHQSFSDYSERSKRRIRQEIKSECQVALDFLGLFDLIPAKVEFYNHIDGAYESVCLINENELESSFMHDLEVTDEITDEQLDNVHLLLYIKDKFQISDKAWHELAMKSKDLPTSYGIKKRIQELNAQWNVFPTPGSAEGVQMKLKDSLTEQVTRLLKEGKLHNFDSLKIKLSGDGTRVGKRLQLLNVTYTIINEGNVAMSEKGNYVIAVIKTKDDYEGIRESLAELREETRNLNEITVNQKTFNIEYFLGGD